MSEFDYDSIDCPKFLDFAKATSPRGSGADESYFERHEESPAGGIALRKPAAVVLAASTQPKSAMNTACALQDVKEQTSSQASTSACPPAAPAGVHKPSPVPLLTKALPKQGKENTAAAPAPPAWRSTFATRSHASDPQSGTASLLRKFCGLRVDAGNTAGKQAIKQASGQPCKLTNVDNKKGASSGLPRAMGACAGNTDKQAIKQVSSQPGRAIKKVDNKKGTASSLPRAMPGRPGRPLGTRDTNVVPCHTTTTKQPVPPSVKKTFQPVTAPALRTQPGPIAGPWRLPGVQATRLQHAGPRPGYATSASVAKPSKGCSKEVKNVDSLRSRQDGSVVLVLRASLDEAPGIRQLELMEPYEARAYFDTLVGAFADNENEGGELVSFEETNTVEKALIGTLVRGYEEKLSYIPLSLEFGSGVTRSNLRPGAHQHIANAGKPALWVV
ncbi:hypothetical protein HPB50_009259 [Hyalomma asiaticum]|uniref:Uncharacterized protein n=1 Tax=Hyalomma asiaticum TaxID=266040 RepID=A0ACB7T984_HYAAI|nr:hypothetical protein HPB50_009259 [Hyalomma asiaticum]